MQRKTAGSTHGADLLTDSESLESGTDGTWCAVSHTSVFAIGANHSFWDFHPSNSDRLQQPLRLETFGFLCLRFTVVHPGHLSWIHTPLKFNIAPEKMVVGRLLSYWEGDFSGAMLNFGRVYIHTHVFIHIYLHIQCWLRLHHFCFHGGRGLLDSDTGRVLGFAPSVSPAIRGRSYTGLQESQQTH